MKDSIRIKINKLASQASKSESKFGRITLVSGSSTSLSKAVKSKGDAKVFMQLLKIK